MLRRTLTATVLAALLLLPVALLRAADPPKGDKDLDGDWVMTPFANGDSTDLTAEAAKTKQVYTFNRPTEFSGEGHGWSLIALKRVKK